MPDWWDQQPWRQIQTNLREIDMLDIDADRVVADLREFAANRLMINAAGIIASYPTKLPFHFQSPYLKGDSLETIIARCHDSDIRVVARTDFSKVRRPIYETHPEWAYRDPQGKIVDYNGDIAVCVNGDYQQRYALEIIEELITTHDFDGIFFNMGGFQTRDYSGTYHGICHCDSCRRLFAEQYDLELPEEENRDDPVFRRYSLFKQRTVDALREKTARFIERLRPDMCIDRHLAARRGFVRQESNTAIGRALPRWQYSGSDNTRWAVGSYPEMVSSNTTVDFIDFPYRHAAVSPHEQKLRLAQNLASGGGLDYYLIGRLDNHEDRSGFAAVKEIFHYHAAHEDDYRDLRSLAGTALLKQGTTDEFRGWFRILVEHHFLFDTIVAEAALDVPWDRYDTIVLPDVQCVDDRLAKRLDQFVKRGGTLIATAETSLRDAEDEPRPQPALDCLGIDTVLEVRRDMRSSYIKLDRGEALPRSADTDLVFVDGAYVYARYAESVEPRHRLVPPHNFGPPERCYYDQVTEHPGLTVNAFGDGRAVYIPWSIGSLYLRHGYPNSGNFAADALSGAGDLSPLAGNLSPMVEVTLHEGGDGAFRLLHLVNGSGHFGVSYFEPVTMHDIEVTIRCPRQPTRVASLRGETDCDVAWDDGSLQLNLARLDLFDALKIEFPS